MTESLHGVIPAVLTPFDQLGEVDASLLREYVDWLIGRGVHGLYPCGTNGEGPSMTAAQRMLVAETVIRVAAGRLPVVPMTGAISTAETLELTRHAREAGAAGAAVVTPWYFTLDDQALEAHFSAIAEGMPDFDLYLYNIPANAGNGISPELAARLATRYPHIRGIKDSSKSYENLKAYLAALPGRAVIVGSDSMLYEALEVGAAGVVSGIADCFPEVMVAIYEAWRSGAKDHARNLQKVAGHLRDALKHGPPIHPYKLAAAWRGVNAGGMRPPLRHCTAAESDLIWGELLKLGVI